MPGFPVHHQLLELAQTHVHQVSDAIQPSYSLLSHSPPTFNLSQHQASVALLKLCVLTPVRQHYLLNAHEFEQTLGDGGGQGSPVCCNPWGCKESDTTDQQH